MTDTEHIERFVFATDIPTAQLHVEAATQAVAEFEANAPQPLSTKDQEQLVNLRNRRALAGFRLGALLKSQQQNQQSQLYRELNGNK